MRPGEPPRWAELFLAALLPRRYRDQHVGDLSEGYHAREKRVGPAAARRWYRRQVLTSLGPALWLRVRHSHLTKASESGFMEQLWQDLRYGVRAMVKNPGFAIVSTTTLALAVGVNTAIFSLVSIMAFADLPMQDADGVAYVWMTDATTGQSHVYLSHQDLVDLRENSSFESLVGLERGSTILTGSDDPVRVETGLLTGDLWASWRLPMAIGRGFRSDEDQPGGPRVVVLAYGFWQERYAGSLDVLDRILRVNGREHTVVGVASPLMEFGDLAKISLWLPAAESRTGGDRAARRLRVSGRLRPGVPIEQANQEMAAMGERLSVRYPETNGPFGVHVLDVKDSLMGESLATIFLLMSLSVTFVLLIACANVANMLLARSTSRARELAVREALGAGRGRIVRQLLTESLLISVAAGLIGLALAHGIMRLMVFITRGQELLFTMATLDREVLGFTLIVTMAAPLAFGLIPALRASRSDLSSTLKEGRARGGGGRRGGRVRGFLVVSQISLALVLMILAGVAARSVMAIGTLDRGFDGSNVLSMIVELPEGEYSDDESVLQFFDKLLVSASAIPDAEAVALVNTRPGFSSQQAFEIEGKPVVDDRDQPRAARTIASPGYLDLLRIPLLRGRNFNARDGRSTVGVAVVNRAAVDKYWPGEDPIGQRVRLGPESEEWLEIVGVAGGTEFSATGPSMAHVPQIYMPAGQRPGRSMTLMIRTRTEPTSAVTAARSAVAFVDPNQPVDDVRTMEQYSYDMRSSDYAIIALFVTFALFALAMAAMGIYGVMSYMVSERTAEISLRMALGAERGNVLRMILYEGSRLMVLGTGVGVVGALLMSRIMATKVVGVSERDPLTFIGVPVVLALVALIAICVPALRATRVAPMQAMRSE